MPKLTHENLLINVKSVLKYLNGCAAESGKQFLEEYEIVWDKETIQNQILLFLFFSCLKPKSWLHCFRIKSFGIPFSLKKQFKFYSEIKCKNGGVETFNSK